MYRTVLFDLHTKPLLSRYSGDSESHLTKITNVLIYRRTPGRKILEVGMRPQHGELEVVSPVMVSIWLIHPRLVQRLKGPDPKRRRAYL